VVVIKTQKMKLKWPIRLLGFVIFIIILKTIDAAKLYSLISRINLTFVFVGIFGVFPVILIKVWRWQSIMKTQNIHFSLYDCYLMYFVSLLLGVISPGKIGDFSRVLYLRQDGNSWEKSFLSIILDRIFDVVSLIIIGYISMFFFISIFSKAITLISVIFVILFIIFFVILRNKRIMKKLFYTFLNLLIPDRFRKETRKIFINLYHDIKKITIRSLIINLFLTVVHWGTYYLLLYTLLRAINVQIPLTHIIMGVSIASLVNLIPISVAGIGTRDAALIVIFSLLGTSKEYAILLSLTILFLYFVYSFWGSLSWLKKPLPFRINYNQR
jgi:uncharacterized protein (TIRG00374 family)